MKEQHSTSGDHAPASPEGEEINHGFEEYGEPSDFLEYWPRFLKKLDEEFGEDYYRREGPHLFTVDEMRAAGALDCPPELRKSLRVKRDQLPLFGDEDMARAEEPPIARDADGDASVEAAS